MAFLTRFSVLFLLIGLFASSLLYAEGEQADYQAAREIDEPEKRAMALLSFVDKYPESKNVTGAYWYAFNACMEVGNEASAVDCAEGYLNSLAENRRGRAYNRVAWSLAEKGLGISAAVKYAEKAVEWAKSINNPRMLKNILDTQAFAVYKNGDAVAAEKIQLEAMEGNENNADMLGRLALYEAGAGKTKAAIRTAAKASLLGGETEDFQHFIQWVADTDKNPQKQMEKKAEIVTETVHNYFGEAEDVNHAKRSQAAIFMVKADVNVEEATDWAKAAVKSIDESTSVDNMLKYHTALATAYFYQEKYEDALNAVFPVIDYASPWDSDYWYIAGQAFEKNGNQETALRTYALGLTVMKPENIQAAYNALYEKKNGSNDGQDEYIEKVKAELINFNPIDTAPPSTSGRVVLAEMFTGAECPPCVSANYAYHYLGKYYPRSDLAILKYHLHIPGPDPMTNYDTEARYAFYGKNFGTPTAFINGEKVAGGGPRLVTKTLFHVYDRNIKRDLQEKSTVMLKATSDRQKEIVTVDVMLKAEDEKSFGKNVALNVALVEKDVAYEGSNGVPHHGYVVRKLLSGGEGDSLELGAEAMKIQKTVDLTAVEKELAAYLDEYPTRENNRLRGEDWKARTDKMNYDNLAVVAWVQDNESKAVLQAYFVDVPTTSAAK